MTEPWRRTATAVSVYLVVLDRGGLFGAWLDQDRAHQAARAVEGVVVPLAGYRLEPTPSSHSGSKTSE